MVASQPEPQKGIEPLTARLRIECSTTELLWQLLPEVTHALTRTRTATPCGTTPSRWRVYQFHHQGVLTCILLFVPFKKRNGADGARTRDLRSDSAAL